MVPGYLRPLPTPRHGRSEVPLGFTFAGSPASLTADFALRQPSFRVRLTCQGEVVVVNRQGCFTGVLAWYFTGHHCSEARCLSPVPLSYGPRLPVRRFRRHGASRPECRLTRSSISPAPSGVTRPCLSSEGIEPPSRLSSRVVCGPGDKRLADRALGALLRQREIGLTSYGVLVHLLRGVPIPVRQAVPIPAAHSLKDGCF